MLKQLLVVLLFVATLFAKSHNFSELRYSDATGKYTLQKGSILFSPKGIEIRYPKSGIKIVYDDGILHYFQKDKELQLGSMQTAIMSHYFDILQTVHNHDKSEIEEMFDIQNKEGGKILKPTGAIKNYIKRVETSSQDGKLIFLKLFLQNNDTISITIDD